MHLKNPLQWSHSFNWLCYCDWRKRRKSSSKEGGKKKTQKTLSPQILHFQNPFLLSAGEKGLPVPLWKGKMIRSCTPSSIVLPTEIIQCSTVFPILKVHGSFPKLRPQSGKKKSLKDSKIEWIRHHFGGKTLLAQETSYINLMLLPNCICALKLGFRIIVKIWQFQGRLKPKTSQNWNKQKQSNKSRKQNKTKLTP